MDRKQDTHLILVVDDDHGLNRLMRRTLERQGYATLGAHTGAEALQLLQAERVDLLLLDQHLPDTVGAELVESARSLNALPPFVVITGQGDERCAVDMMKRGARDYLVKERGLLDVLPAQIRQVLDQLHGERRLAAVQQALRASERKYRELVELAQEGIWALDHQGRTTFVNPCMARMLGYEVEEMIGRNLVDFVRPEDIGLTNYFLNRRRSGINEKHSFEFVHKNGQRVYTRLSCAVVQDENGDYKGAIACVTDITEQKLGERVIMAYQKRLRSMASELALAEERERRRIAVELHDRIGQGLIFSKMQLDGFRDQLDDPEQACLIGDICSTLDRAIQDTRTLTFDLSSPTLYEFGLEAAAEELLFEHFDRDESVHAQFFDDGQPKPLAEDIRVLLFQVIRELIINVTKHAHARNVKLSIYRNVDRIKLLVEDDGMGFEMPPEGFHANRRGGFGLFSIQERLDLIGGHLEVESEPGHGTRIAVTAPLRGETDTDIDTDLPAEDQDAFDGHQLRQV